MMTALSRTQQSLSGSTLLVMRATLSPLLTWACMYILAFHIIIILPTGLSISSNGYSENHTFLKGANSTLQMHISSVQPFIITTLCSTFLLQTLVSERSFSSSGIMDTLDQNCMDPFLFGRVQIQKCLKISLH